MKTWLLMVALLAALTLAGCASEGLRIAEQGSFAVGGTVVKAPGEFDFAHPTRIDGRTLHGDHAAVSYQIPVDAKAIPLVFLSGFGQTSRYWDTTPDGREGWRTTFLRRGWPVYLVDQPRRGSAGRTTVAAMPATVPDDQLWLENFRIHAGAFPEGEAAMDQFLRWMTPDTGPIDGTLVADSLVALTQKIGPAVLFTHSQGGIFGWAVPGRGGKVAAIVAIEPGAFPFPKGEVPVRFPTPVPSRLSSPSRLRPRTSPRFAACPSWSSSAMALPPSLPKPIGREMVGGRAWNKVGNSLIAPRVTAAMSHSSTCRRSAFAATPTSPSPTPTARRSQPSSPTGSAPRALTDLLHWV